MNGLGFVTPVLKPLSFPLVISDERTILSEYKREAKSVVYRQPVPASIPPAITHFANDNRGHNTSTLQMLDALGYIRISIDPDNIIRVHTVKSEQAMLFRDMGASGSSMTFSQIFPGPLGEPLVRDLHSHFYKTVPMLLSGERDFISRFRGGTSDTRQFHRDPVKIVGKCFGFRCTEILEWNAAAYRRTNKNSGVMIYDSTDDSQISELEPGDITIIDHPHRSPMKKSGEIIKDPTFWIGASPFAHGD